MLEAEYEGEYGVEYESIAKLSSGRVRSVEE